MSTFLKLKKSNCKNCYKCIRNCPVKSIRFSGNQANIVNDECILCGQCFVVCPQNAKEITSEIEKVKMMLSGNEPVIASIAPSFIANYNGIGINSLENALKKLGFHSAEETAIGATYVKKEYDRIVNDAKQNIVISSSCHSVNLLIQKYYPSLLPFLADVSSPMQAHCIDIKKRFANAKTVFIGPCLAKKDEAEHYEGIVDAVLTFEELTNWFSEEHIVIESSSDTNIESKARLFPTTGGILKTMLCQNKNYSYLAIDGVENCKSALEDIINGELTHCFIEMSACLGSCIGGPVMEKYHRTPVRDFVSVTKYAGESDFLTRNYEKSEFKKKFLQIENKKEMPSDAEIQAIFRQMGKMKPSDELNCGSCGYNTCRDKAIAVYHGKADLSMCMPFLNDKAESFSSHIVNHTPNGIIVTNEQLEVQQINQAALKILKINRASDVLGEQVVRILEPSDFIEVKATGHNIHEERKYFAEYNKYVEQSIIYDKEYRVIMCILRDVTSEEVEKEKKEQINRQTIETADKVVEKQMRIVHEIASLLGETAAETKIALTKLKESISDE